MSTVLVVDDAQFTREAIAKLLQLEGYRVNPAANGKEAWATLYTDEPDLILLDLMMPMMDGIQFLELLRRNERWSELPVIVLTGAQDAYGLISRAWDMNIKQLVEKGTHFDTGYLLTLVRQHMRPPKMERPARRKSKAPAAGNGNHRPRQLTA